MPNNIAATTGASTQTEFERFQLEMPGVWAKRYFLAAGAVMEGLLRPFDLGNTQWYVLYRLTGVETLGQRDLTLELGVERATLSGVVAAMVRKGLVEQLPDPADQRQKLLRLTDAGRELWAAAPDPRRVLADVAFGGESQDDIDTMNRVLAAATARLLAYKKEVTAS